ncbi:hypothetical protein FA95DRAFT_1460167, partial [Auriscalpium vulgare]
LEIGGPMASLYLLGHPDHYTMHLFAKLFWKNYSNEVLRFWSPDEALDDGLDATVVVKNIKGSLVGQSAITDYTCRPKELLSMNVYDWIRTCTKSLKRNS